jgi:hypothetical protein
MRQLLALIAGLMLVLTLWTGLSASAAHAAEIVGCVELSASAGEHVAGDSDEVPGDADNPMPHHHSSCHNHHLGVPANDGIAAIVPAERTTTWLNLSTGLASIVGARDLRPPIA